MSAEYKNGEIAHVSNPHNVVGIINPGAEFQIKKFRLQPDEMVTITRAYPSKDDCTKRHTGGAVYDCFVERNGVTYQIEHLPQIVLYSKAGWELYQRLNAKLQELEAQT